MKDIKFKIEHTNGGIMIPLEAIDLKRIVAALAASHDESVRFYADYIRADSIIQARYRPLEAQLGNAADHWLVISVDLTDSFHDLSFYGAGNWPSAIAGFSSCFDATPRTGSLWFKTCVVSHSSATLTAALTWMDANRDTSWADAGYGALP